MQFAFYAKLYISSQVKQKLSFLKLLLSSVLLAEKVKNIFYLLANWKKKFENWKQRKLKGEILRTNFPWFNKASLLAT